MKYFTINPPAKLAGYVRFFWVLEGEASPGNPYIHRSMADGCAELLFHYQGTFEELMPDGFSEKSFSSGLAGQSQCHRRFSIDQHFGIFGVYFYPFAVPQIFSIPSTESRNGMIDLRLLIGSDAAELEEKMMSASTTQVRVETICQFIEKRMERSVKPQAGIVELIKLMIQSPSIPKVEELAKQNFLSTRQFERNFKTYTGFNPKLFSRIIRFQKALSAYDFKEKSLTEIAYDCGYYDQAHFIQDFKEFSGHNPKEYFSGKAEAAKWRE
ncbi:MAG TPA: helix-turn-helix domain-containing protein [Cytophagaceae bacterium]|jgi:AraC-like DNA-binding protein